eukprot:785375-Amphidinium_carterae.1
MGLLYACNVWDHLLLQQNFDLALPRSPGGTITSHNSPQFAALTPCKCRPHAGMDASLAMLL